MMLRDWWEIQWCDVTEDAAELEPAWKGAGVEVGLQIWRIVVSAFCLRLSFVYYWTGFFSTFFAFTGFLLLFLYLFIFFTENPTTPQTLSLHYLANIGRPFSADVSISQRGLVQRVTGPNLRLRLGLGLGSVLIEGLTYIPNTHKVYFTMAKI